MLGFIVTLRDAGAGGAARHTLARAFVGIEVPCVVGAAEPLPLAMRDRLTAAIAARAMLRLWRLEREAGLLDGHSASPMNFATRFWQ